MTSAPIGKQMHERYEQSALLHYLRGAVANRCRGFGAGGGVHIKRTND